MCRFAPRSLFWAVLAVSGKGAAARRLCLIGVFDVIFADLFFVYLFLPICLICYFITKDIKARNAALIVFSLVFYAWGEPVWVAGIIIASFVEYINGLVASQFRGKAVSKVAVCWSVVFNIGLIALFKYTDSMAEAVNSWFGYTVMTSRNALPIGLSFYVLRAVSYTVDCALGKTQAEKNYFRFLLFTSMFPQVMAGPAVRYAEIGEELHSRRTTVKDFSEGMSRIILGLAKKAIVANSLHSAVISLFGTKSGDYSGIYTLSALGTWYGALLVALWYYYDFSGYSDIAIGLGRIFGFHFRENFRYPFAAKSVTSFWKRTACSVNAFFRRYIQHSGIFGKFCTSFGLFAAAVCMGIWHGLSLNFIVLGIYLGVLMLAEAFIGREKLKKIPSAVSHIYTKVFVIIGFGMFYFEESKALKAFFGALFAKNSFADSLTGEIFLKYIWLVIAACVMALPVLPRIRKNAAKAPSSEYFIRVCSTACNVALLLLSTIILAGGREAFIYFSF